MKNLMQFPAQIHTIILQYQFKNLYMEGEKAIGKLVGFFLDFMCYHTARPL